LASTPPNSDAFIREVDDELRRDQALHIWQNYGKWIIVAVVAALALLAAWLWWENDQKTRAGVEGEALASVLDGLSAGQGESLKPKIDELSGSKNKGVSAAARIVRADLLLQKNDIAGAAAAFASVAGDASLAQPYRDMALVRQTAAEFDTMTPDAVIARLKPLAAPGNPWFGSAGEMVGLAYLKQGKPDLAAATFAAIAKDETVPETIRSRVVQLASALGVDALPPKGNN